VFNYFPINYFPYPGEMAASEPRWLSENEQRAWRAYLNANRVLTEALECQLQREADIPHGYYEILVRLSEAPDRELRMSQLAEASISSKSRISHAVSRLEERGWVRRVDCAADKRVQICRLTDAGFTALAAAAPGHVERVRSAVFDALSPAQVTQLRRISEAIAEQINAERNAT
jgi:DNA-binding MarR family transcriptional regulator